MSYKNKPQLKLYKYENSAFVLQAVIDDFQECSFENNRFSAGQFSISINYNIPNALLFERGLFVQFGNNPYYFGEIINITDSIGADGKGSQIRNITGYDARYIFKRRIIKSLNNENTWIMTAKGELCIRNLIADQCGTNAETKRQLPIENTIPTEANAIGSEYSVSESFSNLYEVLCTIATQSEIGWRLNFNGSTLTLECYKGTDRSATVRFDTSYDSLSNGQFTDSAESYANSIYVGGKGTGSERDIYEGENGSPTGLNRYEAWDNQSSMTTEEEYEAEAISMLTQYGQTLSVSGQGLAKCPYVYGEEYEVGDSITISFSGKSAVVQILSVTEHWSWGVYDLQFSFGKPQNDLSQQLQLILKQIQKASDKTTSTSDVKYYTIPDETEMPSADVIYDRIGFVGTCASGGSTFKLYLDNEGTGAKTYHVYFKQLGGGSLTLTTGVSGATDLTLNSGTYVAIIFVDDSGNITNAGATPTTTIESGNTQPATSGAVSSAISGMSASQVGGSGQYIESISQTDGKVSVVAQAIADSVTSDNVHSVSSKAVAEALSNANYLVSIGENNSPDDFPSDAMRIYRVKNYNIGWAGNDGLIINIPWSTSFGYQIALDDQSNWMAVRSKANDVWNSWERVFSGRRLNDISTFSYSMESGYSVTSIQIENVNFWASGTNVFQLRINNLNGGTIGTTSTNVIGSCNLRPVQNAIAIGMDYVSGRPVRVGINTNGQIVICESVGVTQGTNQIFAVFTALF